MTEKTCADRVNDQWRSTKADLERYMNDPEVNENGNDELSPFCEYALSFDYVEPNTFDGQREGYWRYQMSWGGPSDEIRFYGDVHGVMHRAEYWFMDWYDGACVDVIEESCIKWLWDDLVETGAVRAEYDKAMDEHD